MLATLFFLSIPIALTISNVSCSDADTVLNKCMFKLNVIISKSHIIGFCSLFLLVEFC